MDHETTRRRRINGVPPSTTEVIDVETFHFSGKRKISAVIDLSDDEEEDDDVMILNFNPNNTPLGKGKRSYNIEKGESSNPNNTPFVCEICTDTKTMKDAFYMGSCSHAYCSDCVVKYIGSKLEDNIIKILCPFPGCSGLLEAEFCRSILPVEVFERWDKALCEKFYCPFADCSALLINDGTETVIKSECPNCNKIYCAKCKVPWHEGIECSKFEKLNADEKEKEDIMLMNLAKDKNWRRCPNCRIYVDKSEGCNSMKCRCSCRFCYNCGVKLLDGGCSCFIYSAQQRGLILPRFFTSADFPNGNPSFQTQQQRRQQIPTRIFTHKFLQIPSRDFADRHQQQQQQQQIPTRRIFAHKFLQIPSRDFVDRHQQQQQQQQILTRILKGGVPTIGNFSNVNPVYPSRREQIPSRVFTNGVSFNETFHNGNIVYSTQQQEKTPSVKFTVGISNIGTSPNGNSVYSTQQEQIHSRVFTSGISSSGTFRNGNIVYPTQRQEQTPSKVFTGGISTIGTFSNGNSINPTRHIPSRVFTSGVSTSGTSFKGNTVDPTQRHE